MKRIVIDWYCIVIVQRTDHGLPQFRLGHRLASWKKRFQGPTYVEAGVPDGAERLKGNCLPKNEAKNDWSPDHQPQNPYELVKTFVIENQ